MNKRIQLFLLPFAGGSAVSFKNMIKFLDKEIEAISIEYAGHGNRRQEGYILDYQIFLEDVVVQIERQRKAFLPYSILGYSMGGNIAFDIISNKRIKGNLLHAFICARDTVDQKEVSYMYFKLPKEEFYEKIKLLGGIDDRIINNEKFLDIYMEPIIKDYNLLGQYTYLENSCNIPCNTTIIYSDKDTPYEKVCGWKRLVDGDIDYYEMGDNHFFINQYYKEMAQIINLHLI